MAQVCKRNECNNELIARRGGTVFCSRDCKVKFHLNVEKGERRKYKRQSTEPIPEKYLVRGLISTRGRGSIWNVS